MINGYPLSTHIPNEISTHHLQEKLTAEQREILRLQRSTRVEQKPRAPTASVVRRCRGGLKQKTWEIPRKP
jgi:hypothetical protein